MMSTMAQSPYRNESWFAIVRTEIPPDLSKFRMRYPRHGEPLTPDEETAMVASNFAPGGYVELSNMVAENELSSTAAKEIFVTLLTSDVSPRKIAQDKNLIQESDESAILVIIDQVLADPASAQSVADIKDGQDKAIGFLVGQVMKKSDGKANPALTQQLIRKRLE